MPIEQPNLNREKINPTFKQIENIFKNPGVDANGKKINKNEKSEIIQKVGNEIVTPATKFRPILDTMKWAEKNKPIREHLFETDLNKLETRSVEKILTLVNRAPQKADKASTVLREDIDACLDEAYRFCKARLNDFKDKEDGGDPLSVYEQTNRNLFEKLQKEILARKKAKIMQETQKLPKAA